MQVSHANLQPLQTGLVAEAAKARQHLAEWESAQLAIGLKHSQDTIRCLDAQVLPLQERNQEQEALIFLLQGQLP